MSGGSEHGLDDSERLKELGHLSAAVGHNVINAFSAMVSNAELIRSHAKDPDCDLAEVAALGAAIIENALIASHVPRRLIDWTRRVTSPGFDQVGDPPALIDLNQLIRDTVESQSLESGNSVEWSLESEPDPDDPGQCASTSFAPGLPDPEFSGVDAERRGDHHIHDERGCAELGHARDP